MQPERPSVSEPTPADPHLEIRDLIVERGGREVLAAPQMRFGRREVTAVIGPNGAGKSTLLAALQLLLPLKRGELLLDGQPISGDPVAARRRMAAAFQEPLLLSMSVRENVELPLRLRGVGRGERRRAAEEWLERFGVAALARRRALSLSGGEAQRVSLARAFAARPELLLLDEPFAGLDAPTRAQLLEDFARILSEARPTTILVTHDRSEALRLADRVAVLIDGRLRQWGAPQDVFSAPADQQVAEFVGVENVWPARLLELRDGLAIWQAGPLTIESAPLDGVDASFVCVRPEQVTLSPHRRAADRSSARNRAVGRISAAYSEGPFMRVTLELDSEGARLSADISRISWDELGLAEGQTVEGAFKASAVHVIPSVERSSESLPPSWGEI